jgi:hypothetical protein
MTDTESTIGITFSETISTSNDTLKISTFEQYIKLIFNTLNIEDEEIINEIINKYDDNDKYTIINDDNVYINIKKLIKIDNDIMHNIEKYRDDLGDVIDQIPPLLKALAKLQSMSIITEITKDKPLEFNTKIKSLLKEKIDIISNIFDKQVENKMIEKELLNNSLSQSTIISKKYLKYKKKYLKYKKYINNN